jgi:hypothetical protein
VRGGDWLTALGGWVHVGAKQAERLESAAQAAKWRPLASFTS